MRCQISTNVQCMRKLLLPDPHVIGRPQGTTNQADTVGPEMIDGAPAELIAQLSEIVGKQCFGYLIRPRSLCIEWFTLSTCTASSRSPP
ncbi:hypothetical protein CIP107534_01198 [Corynebacterium diphtheriae]|nr:hypothetical protein CIP107534_01198 [Corynebacterium diphtheriae]